MLPPTAPFIVTDMLAFCLHEQPKAAMGEGTDGCRHAACTNDPRAMPRVVTHHLRNAAQMVPDGLSA